MGPPTIPGWSITQALGDGADATVWRARRHDGGDEVALKVIPAVRIRDPRRHLREIWAAGSTGSPHVVAIQDCGQHEDLVWVAMELAAGGDAAHLAAASGGRLPAARAIRIGIDAARGLQSLAEHGCVHRDIKPANILLRSDGSALLGDLAPAGSGANATRSADLAGTPAFLAPEQVRAAEPDIRSDIHGLGATLFALIAGRPPYAGATPLALMRAISDEPVPDLALACPDLPAGLAAVIATAMAKDPAARYQRPDALGADLAAVLASRAPALIAAPRRAAAPARRIDRRLVVAAIAVAGTLVGLGLGLALGRAPEGARRAEVAAAVATAERVRSDGARAAERQLGGEITRLREEEARLTAERDRLRHDREQAPPPAAPAQAEAVATAAAVPTTIPADADPETPAVPAEPAEPAAAPKAPLPPPPPEAPVLPLRIGRIAGATALQGIAANPANGSELLAWAAAPEFWRSLDGGVTWSAVGDRRDKPAALQRTACWSPLQRMILIPGLDPACFGWLSVNGGASFRQLRSPWPERSVPCRQRLLLADGTLYGAWQSAGGGTTIVSASRDGGRSWHEATRLTGDETLQLFPLPDAAGMAWSEADEVRFSADGGKRFLPTATGLGSYGMGDVWFSDGNRLWLSDRFASAILGFDPVAGRWSAARAKVPGLADRSRPGISALVVDPRDAQRIWVAGEDIGLLQTHNGGATWAALSPSPAAGPIALAWVPGNQPLLAAASGGEVLLIDTGPGGEALFKAVGD